MAKKEHVLVREAAREFPFSDAVWAGDTLYISGQIGFDPKTMKCPADPSEEARRVMDYLKHVVEGAGLTMDDLVQVQVFCSDVQHFAAFNEVYKTYFKGKFPARAFLGSGPLLLDARFEVTGIAVRS